MSKKIWGLHKAKLSATAPIDGRFIGIGFAAMGDLSVLPPDREAFKERFAAVMAGEKVGAIPVKAGILFRFVHEMQKGDIVIYPSKADRLVHFGEITGDYIFYPHFAVHYPHRRSVKWLSNRPRTEFSQAALREIGSAITLFKVENNAEEFMAALAGQASDVADVDEETADEVSSQVEESTEDFIIKRLKSKLSPYEFEAFVAHLLNCMGYHARVTQKSGDGGIDIIAHKDELGFEPPIIKVQCKQTLDSVGRPKIQELHGALAGGEFGLFVTLGSYSKDAVNTEQLKANLRLIDGRALVELIYRHYDSFDPSYRMLLPLKRTFIPSTVPKTLD